MKKLTTRNIRKHKYKNQTSKLQMLTCYDFQTAQLLNETSLDLILVGDSLGNVVLGYDTTIEVSTEEIIVFAGAVKRGAPDKFVVADLPFGMTTLFEKAVENATLIFQKSKVEAIKIEGAFQVQLDVIKRLTQSGIPVMGHIGLTPQAVHELGGYYTHGKTEESAKKLIDEAIALEEAGAFSIVLECVAADTAKRITSAISIPTIGIGAGKYVDGDVLVTNDLLGMGPNTPPSFCQPIANLYEIKKGLIEQYLTDQNRNNVTLEFSGDRLYQ